ncbi:Flagellar assembly factor FliW [Fundidesulfovibrio magnetotacticus]|uniref:Flagellar assembly factor FliW n=1 Tax=Fundidesulfovibrio magnetotacticus TaxID=2730080 RepID=A0A6V8LWN9_9BACT|nr:flagellar assembly protein FliW [Fundidesulfovibrio magnetotacticus]GFK92695.1 Flagellar assembly factor FliW [Fundidesulfovibrio magnetotacticus]
MAKKQDRVIQSRIGALSVPPERVLHFPRGLIGFEQEREFTLVQIREDSPFVILQSMNDPRLGLMVADPYSFIQDYDVVVGEAERKILRIDNIRQVLVLVTVTIPPGRPQDTTLNLTGPVVINREDRVGLQVPQVDAKYPTHYRPGEPLEPAGKAQGQGGDAASGQDTQD